MRNQAPVKPRESPSSSLLPRSTLLARPLMELSLCPGCPVGGTKCTELSRQVEMPRGGVAWRLATPSLLYPRPCAPALRGDVITPARTGEEWQP